MQQGRSRRPVRVVMLTLLVASLMVLTVESNHNNAADDEDVLPVLLLDSRRISATDSNAADRYDEREARMALVQPTQSPRAKARREQALRSILAQRRRKAQVASRRSGSVSSSSGSHHGGYPAPTTRRRVSLREQQPLVVPMTGAGVHDLLEMQESQNGLYVTVPEHSAAASNNDTHEIVIQTLAGSGSGSSSTSTTTTTTTTTTVTRRTKPVRSTTTSTTTTTTPSSNAVVGSLEYRGKKTVAMPASLYNHFRPVESNIPIEDMSQFLYFGQKLRGATGKDGSMPSPSPKKLLAGLSDILDDDMNSVDRRPGGAMSSKSTKMRTTSLREHTTKPTCPDKETTNTRANSINSTVPDKAVAVTASSSNLSLRIAVTESPAVTSEAPVITTPSTTTTSTTTPATTTSTAPSTTTSTTTPSTTTTTTQETPRYTVPSRSKQQHEQHQRQRAALRNSSESTGSSSSSSSSAEQRGAITSSSSSSSAAATTASLSAGATVEQAAAASSSSPAAASNHSATAVHKQPQSQQQPQQSPGFTIRWTDARAASKRRRLAAAASSSSSTSNNNRRRDKSSRTTMDELPSSTTPATTTSTTTSLPSSSSTTTTTTETSNDVQQQTTTMEPEQFDTTTTPNPMVDNEVIGATTTVKMLDPSEVQKMYRSSTPKPAPEVINEVSSSSSTTASEDLVSPPSSPSSTTSATTVRVSPPERSPEVRARNLADKAKDDVLPIMQRFNTSSLFNESASTTTTSSTTSTSTTTTNTPRTPVSALPPSVPTVTTAEPVTEATSTTTTPLPSTTTTTRPAVQSSSTPGTPTASVITRTRPNRTRTQQPPQQHNSPGYYPLELGGINRTGGFFEPVGYVTVQQNASEVTSRRHDADALASQETIAIVSYILASLLVFPIAVGVGLILRRLILRNRKVLEESDTSSEISCRKDALNLETGDFKMPIEKTITKLPRIQHLCHEVEKPPPPSSQESRWEFPRDKLRLQTVLGEGNFGQVWKAEADDLTGHQGTTRLVAVKTVKEGASDREKEDLVRELEIMQRVGSHPNVVTLLGCCTEQEPHYLILEYVMYGKLLAYLRDHRTRQDFYNFSEDSAALTSRDLTVFGYCVARGMEYLASKKIIHRDLAARNVLVDHNKLCKIADFGMSRFANEDGEVIETRHGRNALPIRWMAPESLIYSLFTTKTDVWSFGILMWEIVTLGSTPYPDMTAREVMRSVQSGYRLERPSHCRSELFRVIARCWHADPDRRPEFAHLRRDLAQLLEDNMNGHYVDLESFASECTD